MVPLAWRARHRKSLLAYRVAPANKPSIYPSLSIISSDDTFTQHNRQESRKSSKTSSIQAHLRTQQQLYKPIFTRRFFDNMASGDVGVHNLKGKAEFDQHVIDAGADKLVVIDCYATWCGPCKVIAPKVVEFSHKYTDAKFFKIDVDESPDVAQELGVRAMPTFYIYKNGEKVAEVVGANPVSLEKAITANL